MIIDSGKDKYVGLRPSSGLAGLGDMTIGGQTYTTAQLIAFAVLAYLLLKK